MSNPLFTRCRAIGHAWFDVDSEVTPDFGTPFTVRCERCSAVRIFILDNNGDVMNRRYIYPDGYSYSAYETPSRSTFRLDLLKLRLSELPKRKRLSSVPKSKGA